MSFKCWILCFWKKRYVSILVFYYFMGIFVGSNFPWPLPQTLVILFIICSYMYWKDVICLLWINIFFANDNYVLSDSETLYKLEKASLVAEILSKDQIYTERADLEFVSKRGLTHFGHVFKSPKNNDSMLLCSSNG